MKGNSIFLSFVTLIFALSFTGLLSAAEPVATPPTSASPPAATETKPKTGSYLFESIGGYGGSLMVHYGNGSTMNDTISMGIRGFVHYGQAFRLGAMGTMTGRTNFSSSTRDTAGSLGVFGEYLLRFDPFVIGLGIKAGGAGYGSHDPGTSMSGTRYAYFNAMPFAEIEFRLFENVSVGFYGGYDYFVGNSASPSISQGIGGIAITFAKY